MAVTRKDSVVVMTATSDTLSGPSSINSIRAVSTGLAGSAQISIDGVVVWDSGAVAALGAQEGEAEIRVQGDLVATISNCVVYIYLS